MRPVVAIFLFALCLLVLLRVACAEDALPLKDLPSPDKIVAFSNRPIFSSRDEKVLTEDDIRLFLREGKFITDPDSFPEEARGRFEYCDGAFFTEDGKGYFWQRWNLRALVLTTPDRRKSVLVLADRDVTTSARKLEPRRDLPADEMPHGISALANDPNHMEYVHRVNFTLEEMQRFFENARPLQDSYRYEVFMHQNEDEDETRPGTLTVKEDYEIRYGKETIRHRVGDRVPARTYPGRAVARGVLLDDAGNLFFWKKWDDDWLWIEDDRNRSAFFLRIEESQLLQHPAN